MPAPRTHEKNTALPSAPAAWLRSGRFLPWLVLAASLALTWQAWRTSEQGIARELRDYFDFRVREAVTLTEQRMLAQEEVLRGVQGLFAASASVERNEFHAYMAKLRLAENYPGIQGVGFAAVVPAAQKDSHTAAMRREGFPQYAIHPEGRREFYTPILYIEPFSGRNLRAFGYDMYSEPVRRAAMEQARDGGQATLSGKVILVQEADKDVQAGFLMYLPVYRNGPPHGTVAERRANLAGWVYSPFRAADLAQGMYGERAADLAIEIYDGLTAVPAALMYDSGTPGGHPATGLPETERHLTVAGRPWTLKVRALPPLAEQFDMQKPAGIAMTGTFISLLATLLTWLLVNERVHVLRLAQRMNRELADSRERFRTLTESMKDVVWVLDTETLHFLYVSPSVEQLRGYTPEEVLAAPMGASLTPASAAHVEKLLCLRTSAGITGKERPVTFYTDEIEQPCKNGSTVWTETITHFRFNEKTLHVEVHGVSRDISERKRMEQELRASKSFAISTINALSAHICVLDETGTILDVNQAWRDFHDENFPGHEGSWVGINYLAICDTATGPYSEEARPMADGIRSVITGRRDFFTLEYPCHSPDRQRWFNARVTRFQDSNHVVVAHEDITERRCMEEALRRSEERWKFALEGSGDGVWDWDFRTDQSTLSKRFEEILGFPEGGLGHDSILWRGRIHPDDKARVVADADAYLAGFTPAFANEHRMLCKDGQYKWVLARGMVATRDANGTPLRMIGTMTDISARKQAEETLRKLSTAVEQGPTSVIITDSAANIEYVNPHFTEVTGYSAPEVIGRNPRMLQSGKTPKATYAEMWRNLSAGETWHGELLNRRKNGETYWEETHIAPVKDAGGTVTHYAAVKTDITVRKQMEAALKDSEHRYQFLFEDSPLPMYVFDEVSLKFLMVNNRTVTHYGFSREEFSRMTLRDIRPPEDWPLLERALAQSTGGDMSVEWRHRKKNGEIIYITGRTVPIMYGPHHARLAVIQDVTERRLAEQKLNQAMRYNRSLLEASLDPLVAIGEDGRITDVNQATVEVTGVPREQLIGSDFPDYFTEPEKAREGYRHVFLEGFVNDYPLSIRHRDGHTTDVLYSASVYRDENGKVAGVFAAARDITRLKQTAAHVEHLAHFDALTDLPNRSLFNDRLRQALAKARRDKEHCALMFLDLDNFKPVNDTYGHAIGDRLLQEAARRMRDSVRESDTVARLGGDEFIVLLPEVDTEQDALVVAEKIRQVLHQPFVIEDHTLCVSSSIGIAIYPEHGETEAELSNNADIAMYAAKEGGRNNVRLYQPGMVAGK